MQWLHIPLFCLYHPLLLSTFFLACSLYLWTYCSTSFSLSRNKLFMLQTEKKKNHLRLSGGSLVLFSEVNLNLHVFRPLSTTIFTELDIKKNICPVTIFSPFMHMFVSSSLSQLYCTHSKNDLNSKHSPSYNFFLLICLK